MITLGRSEVHARYPSALSADPGRQSLSVRPGGNAGRSLPVSPMVVRRYAEKISGPIRDRIDINQAFLPLRKAYLKATQQRAESSAVVAERVREARDRQRRRLAGSGWQTNGEVSGTYLRQHLPLPDGLQTVDEAVDRGRLSARGVDKVLRLAWTFPILRVATCLAG